MKIPFLKKKTKELDLEVLRTSKVPVLTLDNKWHMLFSENQKSQKIAKYEEKLNDLIKEQGQINNDKKEYSALKKKMMDRILELTTEAFENSNESAKLEMEKNQKNILEINEKLEGIEKRLENLPEEINIANGMLLEETVRITYKEMKNDQIELGELVEIIEEMKKIFKERVSRKTYLDERVSLIYSYLHDVVGAEFIDMLDEEYME